MTSLITLENSNIKKEVEVKEEILKICLKDLRSKITENNIDDLLAQYHVNYFENI